MNIWLQIGLALISVFIGVWLVQQIDNSNNEDSARKPFGQISLGVRFGTIGLLFILGVMFQRGFDYIEIAVAAGLVMGALFVAYRSNVSLDTLVKFALVIGASVSTFSVLYYLCNKFIQ